MTIGLYNKWIISGYNKTPYSFPKGLDDEWFIDWRPAIYTPMNFREECVLSARVIGDRTEHPIKILMSGGKDSEATARCFIEACVPFEGAIVRHERDSNMYDISWAITFCETHNVPYKVYDISICDYYNDDMLHESYASWDRTSEYSNWMWIIDQIGGFCIGSNGCIYDHVYKSNPKVDFEEFSANNSDTFGDYVFAPHLVETTGNIDIKSRWFYGVTEQLGYCWDNWCYKTNKEGLSSFLSYRPEQLLAQFVDPLSQRIFNNEFPGIYNNGQMKNEFYRSHWPEMTPRPKYTGNELIFDFKEYKDFRSRNAHTILQENDIKQKRIFVDDFIKHIWGE